MCFTVLKSSGSGTWTALSGSRVGVEDVERSTRMLWMLLLDVMFDPCLKQILTPKKPSDTDVGAERNTQFVTS